MIPDRGQLFLWNKTNRLCVVLRLLIITLLFTKLPKPANGVVPFGFGRTSLWDTPTNDIHRMWADKAYEFIQHLDCSYISFITVQECEKISQLSKDYFSIYLAPKSHYGRYVTSVPDTLLSGGSAHDAVIVLDPYPEVSLGHVVFVFYIDTRVTRADCQNRGGVSLDKEDCMHLAYRDRCHNVPTRRSRRRNFARRCEINFLPTAYLDTERSQPRQNHLRCVRNLLGYHPCPKQWSLDRSSPALCDPLSHNSHHCVTTPDTIRTSCRVIELCDQAVIVSGGWNDVIVSAQGQERVARIAELLRRNGIKRRNIKIFYANGVEEIQTRGDEQPLRVYPSAMKLALRHHLQQMCRTVRCVDSLVLYLNNPALHGGTMLLWDLDGNGLAEEMERYSVEELLADISNCTANFVQVMVDQSYAGEISYAVKHSRHHGNVVVVASGRGNEYSYAGEFTHFWTNHSETRSCTSHLHRASSQFVTHSHPTIANPGSHRVTFSGAPCDVKPPFTNRELRREFFGCQNLPTAVWMEDVFRWSRSRRKNRSN